MFQQRLKLNFNMAKLVHERSEGRDDGEEASVRKETVKKRIGKYLPYPDRKRPIQLFELTERATATGRGRVTSFQQLSH